VLLPEKTHAQLPRRGRVAVGFSGGLDSTVLLDLAKGALAADGRLRALHVNHGLHAESGRWEAFCRDFCARNGIPIKVLRVDVRTSGGSVEARARVARYEAFNNELKPGECLLLAHHLDDQLETLLLRLLRGAGPRGLGGIPKQRKLGEGMLIRPLLAFPRRELADYAAARGLNWIDDDSNRDTGFDRNYCRHQILPLIEQRWPGYRRDWDNSRQLIAETESLLTDLAELDLARCAAGAGTLRLHELCRLSRARQRNALRKWIESAIGGPADPKKLRELPHRLLNPEQANAAEIRFGTHSARRYRDCLYLLPALPPIERGLRLRWDLSRDPVLNLPGNGSLHAVQTPGEGLATGVYEVRYRQGGESCRLARRPTKTLKKILNEAKLEPWLRHRLPLLCQGDAIAAIPGIGIANPTDTHPRHQIEWRNPFSTPEDTNAGN